MRERDEYEREMNMRERDEYERERERDEYERERGKKKGEVTDCCEWKQRARAKESRHRGRVLKKKKKKSYLRTNLYFPSKESSIFV